LGVLFVIDSKIYAVLFYFVFLLLLITYILNKRLLFSLLGVVFLVVAIISLILFFGIYIYELPTHHCPFCFLQKEYNYVGYLLYFLLFLGSFFAISSELENYMKRALLLLSFYMILVSYYVISYYIRNGVLFE
jgi:disulfide bond formation protein DsbB